jgi:tRNA(Ile)-lysidine synthase
VSGGGTVDVPSDLLARCTFPPPGSPLVCGVSGGADSLALLILAVAAGCVVTAVHVDHGLRDGSAAEADVVRATAGRRGAAFRAVTLQVAPGPNLEARARAARHQALGPGAALGHTADDRAETVLVNLLRGAGLDGLAGIRPGPRHPILALRRAETEALCSDQGLEPVVDPTNVDPSFLRNRVRHEALPLLTELAGRDLVPLLDRQAGLLGDVADHLRAEAAAVDVTDAVGMRAVPVPVARVAVREWLRADHPERHPPDAATVERVLAVARGEIVGTDVGRNRRVQRSQGRLALVTSSADDAVR